MAKARVLIVDDNETGIKVLAQMLSTQNVDYIGVQDPAQLDNMLAELKSVDAIFLDLEMPKIDGYEMLKIFKGEMKLKAPIIAYSVHTSEINTAKELGFDGFLGKPLRMQNFPAYLASILKGEEVWAVD
jgi:CheY-like chemotaxis protein